MSPASIEQRLSYAVLGVSLIVVTIVFGVRAPYSAGAYYCIAIVEFIMISIAAWKLGAAAVRTGNDERRMLAVAGILLILPWALFSFLPGFGPPWQATPVENRLRYFLLLLSAIAILGGFVVLREALRQAGENFYSTLGFASILLAGPLFVIWAAILLYARSVEVRAGSAPLPLWIISLEDMSDILLFFGGLLTYLATAAFAASLRRVQWLRRWANGAFVIASLFAVLCLAIRGLQFPDPMQAFAHWYGIPGFVAGIPAIPWVMPCLFGISLLRRAGG